MSIHSIEPAPVPGLTRREALRLALTGSLGLAAAGILSTIASASPP